METLLVLVTILVILRLAEVMIFLVVAVNYLLRKVDKDIMDMIQEDRRPSQT